MSVNGEYEYSNSKYRGPSNGAQKSIRVCKTAPTIFITF
jgi:hypothetical protein